MDKDRNYFLIGVLGAILLFGQMYSYILEIVIEQMDTNTVNTIFAVASFLIVPLFLGYFFAWTVREYSTSTEMKKIRNLFKQIYFGWIPFISVTIGLLFLFAEDIDVIYLMVSGFFLIFQEYDRKERHEDQSRTHGFTRHHFILLQFSIQSWLAFLVVHFWLKQEWQILGLMIPFVLSAVVFWLKPETVFLDHVLILRFYLIAYAMSIIWVTWHEFDLVQIFNIFADTHPILNKLPIDILEILYFWIILSQGNSKAPSG